MESLFIQLSDMMYKLCIFMYKYQFQKHDSYDSFCGPLSQMISPTVLYLQIRAILKTQVSGRTIKYQYLASKKGIGWIPTFNKS